MNDFPQYGEFVTWIDEDNQYRTGYVYMATDDYIVVARDIKNGHVVWFDGPNCVIQTKCWKNADGTLMSKEWKEREENEEKFI